MIRIAAMSLMGFIFDVLGLNCAAAREAPPRVLEESKAFRRDCTIQYPFAPCRIPDHEYFSPTPVAMHRCAPHLCAGRPCGLRGHGHADRGAEGHLDRGCD